MRRVAKAIGTALLALLIVFCLAATIIPAFLDRVYYRGPVTDHFDGRRFYNPDGEDTVSPPGGGNRSRWVIRYLTGNDDRPAWPTRVAVAHHKLAARVEGEAMVATWIGHASVLIQTQGLNILTDPVWSRTAGPFGFGPERVAEPGVRFEDLPKIDLVLVSHNHYDHMDLPTLKRLWERDRPTIVTSLGNDALLRGIGIPVSRLSGERGVVALDWGGVRSVEGPSTPDDGTRPPDWQAGVKEATVIVTRNHHWDSRWFADRNRALWSSFVVQLPGGNIFFSGDTGMGDGKWPAEAAAYGPVRLAMIPIGAFRFAPGQMGIGSHIGPIDAVRIYDRLGASTAIPIHWGTFRLSYEAYYTPPKMLDALMRCTGGDPARFHAVAIGEPVAIPAISAGRRPVEGRLAACARRSAVKALR